MSNEYLNMIKLEWKRENDIVKIGADGTRGQRYRIKQAAEAADKTMLELMLWAAENVPKKFKR